MGRSRRPVGHEFADSGGPFWNRRAQEVLAKHRLLRLVNDPPVLPRETGREILLTLLEVNSFVRIASHTA